MSKTEYDQLKNELDRRVIEERPRIAKHVAEAVDFGDLPENADWDTRLEEERFNEIRIKTIQEALENAEIVDDALGVGIADANDIVTAEIDGKEKTFELRPDSPIGRALYSQKAGYKTEIETPQKTISLKLISVKKYGTLNQSHAKVGK